MMGLVSEAKRDDRMGLLTAEGWVWGWGRRRDDGESGNDGWVNWGGLDDGVGDKMGGGDNGGGEGEGGERKMGEKC